MKKINTIDLFAGCGGLMDGFEQSNLYNTVAAVEWEKAPCLNLIERLKTKWKYKNAANRVLNFDIQRTEELFNGWNDEKYGVSDGLDKLVAQNGTIDVIIGGPPCQAYSVAGRVRDANGMKDDYRNFLFESYIKVVKHLMPRAFVFENVPGILSACPTGEPIIEIIREGFRKIGYEIISDLSKAVVDFSEYGVPQNRSRIIILGLNKNLYGDNTEKMLNTFYTTILPKYKVKKKVTVREAISDLPKLMPVQEYKLGNKKYSHQISDTIIHNHEPRFHNERDKKTFSLLAKDIESGKNLYTSVDALKKLYTDITGHTSNVHKYHVIRWDEPSNLIPAHLYKDGLRHIHPDSKQERSITVREAARLQGFPDDYVFLGTQAEQYKMIGNAVPPIFSKALAKALYKLLFC